jgi:predicted negative regulator of RcsB-dependent stress response
LQTKLTDVVEDLMGELKRADNIIQDYKIKEVDRTFYISQLSEYDENLKALSKEKEEQYNKLTDRIVGLSDVLEGTSEELRKAFDKAFVCHNL